MSNLASAQQKTFVLINKKNHDSIFINENHRIKLFTFEGKKFAGKLKIIDENTIVIKSDTITISSIIQIKKASTFSTIVGSLFGTIGSSLIIGGIIGVTSNDSKGFISPQAIGTAALILGTPMLVIPLSDNEHRNSKWDYKIVQNYNSTQ